MFGVSLAPLIPLSHLGRGGKYNLTLRPLSHKGRGVRGEGNLLLPPGRTGRMTSGAHDSHKWVYLFKEGNAGQRGLLGGKGANLAEMTNAGLPVPPGFTITTEACNDFLAHGEKFPDGMWDQLLAAMKQVESAMDRTFGDPKRPLLVSVR